MPRIIIRIQGILSLFLTIGLQHGLQAQLAFEPPGGEYQLTVSLKEQIQVSLQFQEDVLLEKVSIGLDTDYKKIGINPRLIGQKVEEKTEKGSNTLGISSDIDVKYNEINLDFDGGYTLQFRLFNNGFAYRFHTNWSVDSILIQNEWMDIQIDPMATSFIYSVAQDLNGSYEEAYQYGNVKDLPVDSLLYSPLLIEHENGVKIGLLDAGVLNYPVLYFQRNGEKRLEARFSAYPRNLQVAGFRDYAVHAVTREPYIASAKGRNTFSWRLFILAKEDKELLSNQLAYVLAGTPDESKDFSWVKPGKSTWEWWHNNSLTGLPFEAGMNTQTYQYYIDFASKHRIEYITIDEGWSKQGGSLLDVQEELDLLFLHEYARSKNVGIFLWVPFQKLSQEMDGVMEKCRQWGTAGLKVDFFERDDQLMITQIEELAAHAAHYRLLLNLHGVLRPFGLQRKYPNILNHEGVKGMEYNKGWGTATTPEYALQIPFIRMLSGYMDYTPGAMRNRNTENFGKFPDQPMSLGTRCQQLAMYIVYFAPLQMLCDSPTVYEKESEVMEFLSSVPTVWDETIALDGQVGEFVLLARRKKEKWYLGAMTGWQERELTVKFDFLPPGSYDLIHYKDGPNASTFCEDFLVEKEKITQKASKKIKLAPGGGAVMIIQPKKN